MEFSDAWLAELGALGLPLATLDFWDCRGFSGTGLGELRTLTDLILWECVDVSDAGLAAVGSLPLLHHLDLEAWDGKQMGLFSIKGLRSLSVAPRLQRLCLQRCDQVCPKALLFTGPNFQPVAVL